MPRTKLDHPITAAPVTDQLARAWAAVVLIPVFFLVSLAGGYVLYDLLGYMAESNDAPLWVDLLVALPVLLVALMPCAAAVVYGRRSHRAGDRRGLVPTVLGGLVGLALIALTVVTTVADAIG